VAAQEPRCPYCGTWRPGMFGYGPALQKLIGVKLDVSNAITAVCIALYLLALALDPSALLQFRGIFELFSPSGESLARLGMTGTQIVAVGHWWTLCTAVFLHGSLLHIGFNLVIMRRYLPEVAGLYGNARAFVIFMVAGIAGFVLSNLFGVSMTIGASGSIFGLLGALISFGRRTGQSHITNQLWTSAIMMFVMGFFMGHVNNWAHAGGFIGGFVCAELMPTTQRREGPLQYALAGGLALVSLAGFVLSLLTARDLLGG
jgi:rhomboid protease GluP